MVPESRLCLHFADGGRSLNALGEVNQALAAFGSRVWPLDLTEAPAEVRQLLGRTVLTAAEAERVKQCFLLSGARLLEVISGAGRTPHVQGGGALATFVANHGYAYPQLFVAEEGADYSRFDRFHVNVAEDGTGVDEMIQLLSGGPMQVLQRRAGQGLTTLHLECPADGQGWLITYDGAHPHIGSLSAARPGTKVLVQVIGPPRWTMRYEEGE